MLTLKKKKHLWWADTLITSDLTCPQDTQAVWAVAQHQLQLNRSHFTQQLCFLWQLHSVCWDHPRNGSALSEECTTSLLLMAAASICPELIGREIVSWHQSGFNKGTSWWWWQKIEKKVEKQGVHVITYFFWSVNQRKLKEKNAKWPNKHLLSLHFHNSEQYTILDVWLL